MKLSPIENILKELEEQIRQSEERRLLKREIRRQLEENRFLEEAIRRQTEERRFLEEVIRRLLEEEQPSEKPISIAKKLLIWSEEQRAYLDDQIDVWRRTEKPIAVWLKVLDFLIWQRFVVMPFSRLQQLSSRVLQRYISR